VSTEFENGSMPDDGELARRIANSGSAAAAEEAELCRRFAPRVRLYGLRHLRDEQAAADLVQRVLMLTLEKLRAGAVRQSEKIGSFILGAARVLAQEMRRRSGREDPLPEDDDIALPAPDPMLDPLARDRLANCLQSLPERERSIVALTYYDEQSSAGIAAALGLVEGNVRVIRHRAIGRLRDCMGLTGTL
jgi:RNA polymerase sigma-70 factor (ECF subfamily)